MKGDVKMPDVKSEEEIKKKYDDNSKIIMKAFIEQLNSSKISKGEFPKLASADLKYTAKLQGERLRKKNADISYNYITENANCINANKLDKDTRYITRFPFYILKSTTDYSVDGKVVKSDKRDKVIFANIIWLLDQNKNEPYCCPNCGAVSTVRELLEGCPFCKTKFLMSDLYPNITNYYDYGKNEGYVNSTVLPFSLLGIPIALTVMWFLGVFDYNSLKAAFASGDLYQQIVQCAWILGGVVVGILAGPLLKIIATIRYAILRPLYYIRDIIGYFKTRRKLPEFMRSFEKNFTLDHFIGKVVYLIRMMVYSDSYDNCAVYCGEPIENSCKDVIDLTYFSMVNAKKMYIEDEYAYIDMDIHMYTYNCKGNRVKKKHEVFNLLMCKSTHAEEDFGFSIHKIECKNCGSSFDATREKHCPYCGSGYNLPDYDWVIKRFKKK